MKHLDNWGHVYGIIFKEFNYDTFIKSLIQSKNKKESFNLDNEEQELIFISEFKEYGDGYCFLIGRTNEEVSKMPLIYELNISSILTKYLINPLWLTNIFVLVNVSNFLKSFKM